VEHLHNPKHLERWTGLNGERTLSIIMAYRPCLYQETDKETALQTVHRQQLVLLQKAGAKETNLRKVFVKDIIKFVNDLDENPNNYTILMMDANEGIDDL
jgi:hypothetical protein